MTSLDLAALRYSADRPAGLLRAEYMTDAWQLAFGSPAFHELAVDVDGYADLMALVKDVNARIDFHYDPGPIAGGSPLELLLTDDLVAEANRAVDVQRELEVAATVRQLINQARLELEGRLAEWWGTHGVEVLGLIGDDLADIVQAVRAMKLGAVESLDDLSEAAAVDPTITDKWIEVTVLAKRFESRRNLLRLLRIPVSRQFEFWPDFYLFDDYEQAFPEYRHMGMEKNDLSREPVLPPWHGKRDRELMLWIASRGLQVPAPVDVSMDALKARMSERARELDDAEFMAMQA